MPRFEVPVTLDLRALPTAPTELFVDMDLPQLLAHAGYEGPVSLAHRARLGSAPEVAAQVVEGGVVLSLPSRLKGEAEGTVLLVAGEPADPTEAPRGRGQVLFSQGPDAVEITIDEAPFATYRYNTADPELPRPYFHPILGPSGVSITQEGEVPGRKVQHFHHTGLVLAHQNFTDGNNWQIGPNFSRMRHLAFDVMQSGPVLGRFVQRLEWPSAKGDRVVFREARTVTVPRRQASRRVLDVDTTITCGEQPAVWKPTPYHLFAIRVPDAMVVASGGAITNSEGQTNQATAGALAKWLDFSGPLKDTCGVAIFNHPQNPRHPTAWLNFENETVGAAPAYREAMVWEPGQSRRFRYRVYFHSGDVKGGSVAQEYEAYIAAPSSLIGAPRRIG